MNLTIIVPTINRPEFIIRLVRYYHSLGFDGSIIIGDGSSVENFNVAREGIAPYKTSVNLRHFNVPGCSVQEAVHKANGLIDSDYVCLVGDDDFIIPKTASACIDFLNRNVDYVAAHGLGILIAGEKQNSSRIDSVSYYPQPRRLEETASSRISAHLTAYRVSLFSVHRRDVWIKMFSFWSDPNMARGLLDKTFAAELLPCCLSVAAGKIAEIDGLYLVRQVHHKRLILPSWLGWISGESWHSSFKYFTQSLSMTLVDLDGIEFQEARKIIEDAFSTYFKGNFKDSSQSKLKKARIIFGKVPLAKFLLNQIRKFSTPSTCPNDISLQGILSVKSPLNSDFMPVYNVVCNQRKLAQ